MTPADRVDRGAELLDRVRPGWADEVGLEDLDMVHCALCMLGQLFGDFDRGDRALFPGDTLQPSRDHGFFASTIVDYRALELEWRRVIAERQAVRQ